MTYAGQQAAPLSASRVVVAESEFPALYRAADQNSSDGERHLLTATRLRLAMLALAAAFGIFTWRTGGGDIAGIGATAAFGVALLSELYLLKGAPRPQAGPPQPHTELRLPALGRRGITPGSHDAGSSRSNKPAATGIWWSHEQLVVRR